MAPNELDRRERFLALTRALLLQAKEDLADELSSYKLRLEFVDWGKCRELSGTDDERSQTFFCVKIRGSEQSPAVYFGFAFALAGPPRPAGKAGPELYAEVKRRATARQEIQFVLPFGQNPRPWQDLTIINSADICDSFMLLYVVRKAIPFVFA